MLLPILNCHAVKDCMDCYGLHISQFPYLRYSGGCVELCETASVLLRSRGTAWDRVCALEAAWDRVCALRGCVGPRVCSQFCEGLRGIGCVLLRLCGTACTLLRLRGIACVLLRLYGTAWDRVYALEVVSDCVRTWDSCPCLSSHSRAVVIHSHIAFSSCRTGHPFLLAGPLSFNIRCFVSALP